MANINLSTSNGEIKKFEFPYKKSLIGMLSLLGLTLVVYGGIVLYTHKIVGDDELAKSRYADEYALLSVGNAKDVYDFQNRLNISGGLASDTPLAVPSLQEIEKIMVAGSHLSSYDYDSKTGIIKLKYVGDDFGIVARQILNFKKSNFFSDVTTGETILDDNGKITANFELKIK